MHLSWVEFGLGFYTFAFQLFLCFWAIALNGLVYSCKHYDFCFTGVTKPTFEQLTRHAACRN